MTTKLKVHATAVLTVLALALTMLGFAGAASPAQADDEVRSELNRAPARNYYGSIAVSPDQAHGYAYDYRTKRGAKARAMRGCKAKSNYPQYCRSMGWVRNGCMAVAIKTRADGWITQWASGWAGNLPGAKRNAKKRLPGSGGRILTYVCTTR